jgi:poly-gamma-glutamate synthesis protein (capsule biosynthesis protein)
MTVGGHGLHCRNIALALAVMALASAATASSPPDDSITVVAIGDVLPGVFYEQGIREGQDPFRDISSWLVKADIAIANLEGPLTDRGTRVLGKKFTFRVPPDNARLLARAGLDVLGLANNHILDFGAQGLEDTTGMLARYGLIWCGAGRNMAEARAPALAAARGRRVAVLAYNLTFPMKYYASGERPGTAYADAACIRADVAKARASGDPVIVLVHWGREKVHTLRPYQRPLARAAIEAGASLVIGTHPHVPQGVERIGKGVAAYSLGDGVFGGATRRREDSLLMRATFVPSGLREVEFFALQASNADTGFAPRIRAGDEARKSLAVVIRLAASLGCLLEPGVSAEGIPCARLTLKDE